MRLALVAAHRGPYESLKPVARAWRGSASWLLDGTAAAAARLDGTRFTRPPNSAAGWDAWLARARPAAILRGTSELPERSNPEASAARAAARRGTPVFALEDFPGNYRGFLRGLTGLFVEFDALRAHHASLGLEAARVHAIGNPRYEAAAGRTLSREIARRRLGLADERTVLWAGQPDTERGRRTLTALVPVLRAHGATLLFRAHPREGLRARRSYGRTLSGLSTLDLSALQDARIAVAAADLVVTQFSTLAVEAAHQGIPALFALLPGAGSDYLMERTGLRGLPWCETGAAFVLERESDAHARLARALDDRAARRAALSAMRAHFAKCRGAAARAVKVIKSSLS